MSKFYPELRDTGQIRVRNKYRRYWCKYGRSSVIEPICLPRARIARCGDAGPGWHKLSVRGARGNILNLTHDIFSVMQSDETRVWPPTRVEWCRHPDTHPPSPGAHKKHLVNSYSCSCSPAPPRPPGQVTDQMHAGPRDPGLELRLMELLPGLEHSEFSAKLH